MTFTHALATNNYGPAKFIVDASAANGTHTTIAAALTSASSGDTIFIRPGTYTENLTLKAGVNLAAYGCDSSLNNTGNVKIIGIATFTGAGTVTISGIQLQTNSNNFLAVTGSAASVVNLNNCFLNCSNNTGINFTSSSSSSGINISYCWGDILTTGISLFSSSSAGTINIYFSNLLNSGNSTTASTHSAGNLNINNSLIYFVMTTSSTSTFTSSRSYYMSPNATILTCGGSGNGAFLHCDLTSGTASAVSVSSSINIFNSAISSSNTNAITGAGIAVLSATTFTGTSVKSNVTTQTGGAIVGLTQGSQPTAGYIGEVITANASSVSMTSTVAKTIASISLTPGIWNVSGMATAIATGGTTSITLIIVAISPTDNTVVGTTGIDYFQTNAVASTTTLGGTTAPVRVTLSTTTTYYVVVNTIFSSTTCPVNGIITATRVG